MAKRTLSGCLALLGTDARQSDGPVDIVIDGNKISDIRPSGSAAPEGEVIDARNRLATPGLINGHMHSTENFHKAFFDDNLPLELWMNYVRPLKPLQMTERQVYLRTLIGAIELIRSGTTTVNDDFNVSPILHREHVEAGFKAYEDIGIRANVGITLFDRPFFRAVPFVDEEFPAELLRELDEMPATPSDEVLAFARELAASRHQRDHRVGYIAAPSAPQRCTSGFLERVREMADEFELPLMIHVQETRIQVVHGQLEHGSTLIEYLHKLGFLKPRTQIIHGIWLTPRDIQILAETGVTVQHNPTVNLLVGSGVMPLRALLDAGVNVSLGSDGCGSVETCDLQKALLTGSLLQKARGYDYTRWVGAKEIYASATVGAARALGRGNELGALEVGRIADITAYRLDRISFTPPGNLLRQLVYSETGSSLDMMFVDGEPVMMDGRLTCIDEQALIEEVHGEYEKLLPQMQASKAYVERMRAPMDRIYRRCQQIPIAEDTHPARLPS